MNGAAARARPVVRVRRPPPLEPPFDDEIGPQGWLFPGPEQLALEWPTAPAVGTAHTLAVAGASGTTGRATAAGTGCWASGGSATNAASAFNAATATSDASATGASATSASGTGGGPSTGTSPAGPADGSVLGASPECRAAARRFAVLCLEILNGYRPAGHVRRLADPVKANKIVDHLAAGQARLRGSRRSTALVGAARDLVGLGPLRVCEPRAGIAEVAAVVRTTARTWALAFRLERCRGTWLCTATWLI